MAYTRYLKRRTKRKTQKKRGGGTFKNSALYVHDKIANMLERKPVGRGMGGTTLGQNAWNYYFKEAQERRHDRARERYFKKIEKEQQQKQQVNEQTQQKTNGPKQEQVNE